MTDKQLVWADVDGMAMTWPEAKALADAKGDGWRLPTLIELVERFDYVAFDVKDSTIQRGWYWSAHAITKDGRSSNWRYSFGTGISDVIFGDAVKCRVRLVRDSKGDS